jgi:hypothetical protein
VKKACLLFVFFFSAGIPFSFAQTEQAHLRISVLTCAPGDELYSIFGHTALRITDSSQKTDLVYNYGTFDFDDPDFYTKFVRGKLNYSLSVAELPAFLYEYQVTKRDVIEQELLLTDDKKMILKNAIDLNLVGNNRYYKYDFLYDNCTSRVRDILIKYGVMKVNKKLVAAGTSFRDMIHEYLDRGNMAWTKLGMDILLGSPADKPVSIDESMFLPDYLLKGIDSAAATQPLLLQKQYVLTSPQGGDNGDTNWPMYLFTAMAVIILLVSFTKTGRAKNITTIFDFLLFFITGLIGVLLLFTWFGTDHGSFATNYNLLWALPTNVWVAFAVWKNPARLKKYFFACSVMYGLLLVLWFWLPQQLNPAFIPIVLVLLSRSTRLAKS